MPLQSVCVYCGSSDGARAAYAEAAETFGRLLAQRGWRMVYGGGAVGLMGRVARSCLEAGGHVTGVMPGFLVDKEIALTEVTELIRVDDMHQRKAIMAQRADAFVALPGGFGTLEEMAEMFAWWTLDTHDKPCAFLNVEGYYDHLRAFFDRMATDGFLRVEYLEHLLFAEEPEALLDQLAAATPPPRRHKWD